MGSPRRLLTGAGLLAAAAALAAPAGAAAAERIYWATRQAAPQVGFANLDNSGGGDLSTTGASPGASGGVTIDAAAGRIYFGNSQFDKISFARLDGSGGGGDLNTTGATVDAPDGLAIDPLAGRIYWANYDANKISFANLDGSGGGDINTTGATTMSPDGVAVDPAAGRIYWANNSSNPTKISFARLDGTGGADLDTSGVAGNSPWGLALDTAAGRVYWADNGTGKISFANLDGSGGAGDLMTPGATVSSPAGAAIDPDAGRIYWGNGTDAGVSFAALDGSGGADLNVSGATYIEPDHLALLKSPAAAGAPAIAGGSVRGSVLACSQGSWAPDVLGSQLYRAPQSFAFQWSIDGGDIAGATGSSHVADAVGTYRCRVTASNAAGSSSQTSPAQVVALPTFGARTLVSLRLAAKRIPARGPVKVRVANDNDFPVSGRLAGRTPAKVNASRRRVVRLAARRFTVGADRRKTVKLRLPRPLRGLLQRRGRLALRLTAKVTDPSGKTRTVNKKVAVRLKGSRRS
jgi:hypothetical protein